ncbi:Ornithine/acetylornithine aminotransferase [Candidatus Sulfotelmatobacter kueseliae]|uniref:Ornithine/acetylornithine aminotransferase n=1 Tax=Candidatus Sulfotelmatobacter kueseliae TaxID=2042962 RepID=A0A2U3L9F4_9BACT|nr:Ornithine/acetylornithine aminotransferase [Candidatus Sulfotelmatobacter kueseliae]
MPFSIVQVMENRQGEQYALHRQHINSSLARVQRIIGFDNIYVRGEGSYLWDADGNRYLDLLSGFSVFNLGRNHPMVKQAIQDVLAADRPNLVKMDCPLLAGLLAEELVKRMPPGLDAVFFANSGADAVDTALKFARAATKRPRILYLDHAFHGLTLSTLAINGGKEFRKGFEPLMGGCDAVPMNDLGTLENELRHRDVAAFVVEPIQGKGVYVPDDNYLPEAQRLCRKYGALFVCDEVQVGMGRTGRFLCCEHWNLEPDIVTLSKSLGGGYVPVSATITRRRIHDATFNRLDRCQVHSTTFGQNELAMAAGLATLHVMDEERLTERAATMGKKLLKGLAALQEHYQMVADVRGKGLMIGIEFRAPRPLTLRAAWTAAETARKGLFAQLVVMALMREHHILTQVAGPDVNIIKLLPSLIIGDEEVEMIVAAFEAVMAEAEKVGGRVWAQSVQLVEHALGRQA